MATGLALFLLRLRNHVAPFTLLACCFTGTNKQHSLQRGVPSKELQAKL